MRIRFSAQTREEEEKETVIKPIDLLPMYIVKIYTPVIAVVVKATNHNYSQFICTENVAAQFSRVFQ